MVARASSLKNKCVFDTDGKTSHEICRGRKFNRQMPEFGDCAMYLKTPAHKGREKLEPRWESGVFLGIHEKSQELIIGTPEGVVESHEFQRKGSEQERWNMEEIKIRKGDPGNPAPTPREWRCKAGL